MKYLFSKPGIHALQKFVDSKTLLAFDYDGTLVGIVSKPYQAKLTVKIEKLMKQLQKYSKVAIVSGRSLADLKKLIPLKLPMVGNHGLEFGNTSIRSFFNSRAIGRWRKAIELCLEKLPGVWLEDKKLSLSIHYRQARDLILARKILMNLIKKLNPKPHLIFGKEVINLLPHAKVDKGTATLKLMKKLKCANVLFAGDDETDEYALKINKPNFLTVRIGKNTHSGAKYFLKNQTEIERLLKTLLAVLVKSRFTNNPKTKKRP